MTKQYKVWVVVEEIDKENETYTELDSPFGSVMQFDSEDAAQTFARELHETGLTLVGQ